MTGRSEGELHRFLVNTIMRIKAGEEINGVCEDLLHEVYRLGDPCR